MIQDSANFQTSIDLSQSKNPFTQFQAPTPLNPSLQFTDRITPKTWVGTQYSDRISLEIDIKILSFLLRAIILKSDQDRIREAGYQLVRCLHFLYWTHRLRNQGLFRIIMRFLKVRVMIEEFEVVWLISVRSICESEFRCEVEISEYLDFSWFVK